MRTEIPKAGEIKQDWYLFDAENAVLGRLATRVATILRGKNKPYFSPHLDTGDFVVVINAEKVKLTGNKNIQKIYTRYSGYPGGLTEIPFKRLQAQKPEEIIIHAVKGMLPKNILGRQLLKKLKVYTGSEHPHQAQKPKTLTLDS